MQQNQRVFVTGGTGYMGSRLLPVLLERGHRTFALTRESSRHKLPPRSDVIIGDALNGATYSSAVEGADTFIHLVGVSHPSPAKAREFVEVDLKAARESVRVARAAAVSHFIYVSVAHPAPVMKAYVDVRMRCEAAIAESGLNATILRPWYVLGPGHRWPYALIPLYKLAELLPSMREGAIRLGLVTIHDMVRALLYAAENPATGQRVLEPKDIRKLPSAAAVAHYC
jgi:uncharacterized protein YbjT (DUF2867 family)